MDLRKDLQKYRQDARFSIPSATAEIVSFYPRHLNIKHFVVVTGLLGLKKIPWKKFTFPNFSDWTDSWTPEGRYWSVGIFQAIDKLLLWRNWIYFLFLPLVRQTIQQIHWIDLITFRNGLIIIWFGTDLSTATCPTSEFHQNIFGSQICWCTTGKLYSLFQIKFLMHSVG